MRKQNIAIFTGGDSLESKSSYASAKTVFNEISPENYNRYIIEVKNWEFKIHKASGLTDELVASAVFDFATCSFYFPSTDFTLRFDGALIAIHGAPGETGQLQAYLEMVKLPFTGSDFFSSALSMHKFECASFLKSASNHLTPRQLLIRSVSELTQIESTIGFPCIVKPNSYGSGMGVSKVFDKSGLGTAFQESKKLDQRVLVQEYIDGSELTVAMIRTKELTMTLPIAEIQRPYENERTDEGILENIRFTDRQQLQKIIPAKVDPQLAQQLTNATKEIGELLDCRSFFRADYIMTLSGELYFLEVNTIPGMTPNSVFTQQILAAQMTLADFYSIILKDILHPH